MDETERTLADYQATLGYFHALHDVRFKLLGFLPVLSGAALAFLSEGLSDWQQLGASLLGLVVVGGLTSYDQRNTQIYDRLVQRAKLLEEKLDFVPLPDDKVGGAFQARPPLGRWKLVWHIQGLTLVYAACLAAWASLGISAVASSPMLAAQLSVGAFGASYVTLRLVSWIHHRKTWKMKFLPSAGPLPAAGDPQGSLPSGMSSREDR